MNADRLLANERDAVEAVLGRLMPGDTAWPERLQGAMNQML